MNSKFKKIITICICSALVLGIGVTVYFACRKIKPIEPVKLSEFTSATDISLVAHRGFSAQAPENTIPAFELAAQKGYNCVEFDIQLTKDGVWVLSHDEKINRMTDGSGKIKNYTYFDLADFSINNGANYKNYDNLKMPSLDSALETCLKHELKPMIEIKDYTDAGLKSLIGSVIDHGFEKSCYIISFDYAVLEKVHTLNSDVELIYLVSKLDEEHLNQCLQNSDIGVSFKADFKHNNKDIIKQLKDNENNLFCWTVNEKENLDYYYEAGVRNFVTDKIIP